MSNVSQRTDRLSRSVNRIFFLRLFLLFLVLLPSKLFAAETDLNIIRGLKAKLKSVKTIQGRLEIYNHFNDKTVEGKASIYAIPPSLFRMEIAARSQSTAKEAPVIANTEVVLDGKNLWFLVQRGGDAPPFIGRINFNVIKRELPDHEENPADELSQLDENQIKVIGQTLFDGKPVYLLSGPLKRYVPPTLFDFDLKKQNVPTHVTLWVGEEDGITYQSMMFDAKGKAVAEVHLTSVVLNQPIPVEKFRFVPPKGETPVDLTPTVEAELEKQHEGKK